MKMDFIKENEQKAWTKRRKNTLYLCNKKMSTKSRYKLDIGVQT